VDRNTGDWATNGFVALKGEALRPKRRWLRGLELDNSILPLRYGAPPDAWLVTLGPSTPK
jgi:hypothetical protein